MRTDPALAPAVTADPPLAARRDASWWNSPGTAYVYHVATTDMAACCFRDQPLAEFTSQDAAKVPAAQRCRRRGCATRWPADPGPLKTFPIQIAVFCDVCGTEVVHDYVVHDLMTRDQRLGVARTHLTRNEGWSCTLAGDLCPGCAT
jgi:hypothetical protein